MSAFWLIFWADVLAQIIRQMAKADTAHASDRGLAYRTSQAAAKRQVCQAITKTKTGTLMV
ncbi:hypothetical protein PKHYL_13150 [Psychrobacter sp. KH172YL61]|nr:hypothetical protein PKHYL_13150 [Psychrobacter sp. KH172YL61]